MQQINILFYSNILNLLETLRFAVLTAVTMPMLLFCVIMYGFIGRNNNFGETHCFHLQGSER